MYIDALFAGKPQAFGPRKSPSSIKKQPFDTLHIEFDGAIEDEQGNKKLHGGPEMAMHQYSQKSYDVLKHAFPQCAKQLIIGSIGENISAPDMNDDNVFIGDVYRMGEVLLQVNSPRGPCVKINQRYEAKGIDLFIAQNTITGWYFRVLEKGCMSVGDSIELVARNSRPVSVSEVMYLAKIKDKEDLRKAEVAKPPFLADEWIAKLRR